ncbi:MAG: hydroxymethylglutaryl-CoA lyase [Bacteroidia bacterium]|nr:hydroxymethylglutaryl-CoA lyase [Bacteroidia bacterium]
MTVKIIECPRDAMQGIHNQIPTVLKIEYINALLSCNFDILDCGSFVSSQAIPQLADTKQVLQNIDDKGNTKLLVIIANLRGAEEACQIAKIDYLGYPFSVSDTFQRRNTNHGREESYELLGQIQHLAIQSGKEVVAYISMGFGNPYKEAWSVELVEEWVSKIIALGIRQISLSDTIGKASPHDITTLFSHLIPKFPEIEFGAHLHTRPDNWLHNVEAAYQAGCRRFDGAIKGFGGCPFAEDKLTGNLPTEKLISFLEAVDETLRIDKKKLEDALLLASRVFN